MHLHDQIPVIIFHVLEADIAQDAGIVDENVDPAKSLDGCLDDLLAILHRVIVGDGFAACGLDLIDDYIRSLGMRLAQARGRLIRGRVGLTFDDCPSPLNEPPRSLTTTLAPREPRNVAYALPAARISSRFITRVRTDIPTKTTAGSCNHDSLPVEAEFFQAVGIMRHIGKFEFKA